MNFQKFFFFFALLTFHNPSFFWLILLIFSLIVFEVDCSSVFNTNGSQILVSVLSLMVFWTINLFYFFFAEENKTGMFSGRRSDSTEEHWISMQLFRHCVSLLCLIRAKILTIPNLYRLESTLKIHPYTENNLHLLLTMYLNSDTHAQ